MWDLVTSMKQSNVLSVSAGVVGGIVGLGGLAILAMFLFKRGRREGPNAIPEPNPFAPDPTMTVPGYEQLNLYNPADPATFPYRVSDGYPSHPTMRTTNPFQLGRYGGAPEI